MLAPIVSMINALQAQGITLAIPLVGLALLLYGAYMIFGNHEKARTGIAAALIGGAIMLGSATMAAAVNAGAKAAGG